MSHGRARDPSKRSDLSPEKKASSPPSGEEAVQKKPERVSLGLEEWNAVQEKAQKAEEYREQVLRLTADFENARKRLERTAQESVKFANEKLVLEILPIMDDLDRAILSLDSGHEWKSVKDGLHLVQNNFHQALERYGVEPIQAVGTPFDPRCHEAVGDVFTEACEEGMVAEEVQRGYLLKGRIARPSKVRIARRPGPSAKDLSHPPNDEGGQNGSPKQ